MLYKETLLVHLEGRSETNGDPNKTVEVDKTKFSQTKYQRRHPDKGQNVFGGVERGSGRMYLVPVTDRTVDTMTNVISAWIEPDTTFISDCVLLIGMSGLGVTRTAA
jgi:hypothetical protein